MKVALLADTHITSRHQEFPRKLVEVLEDVEMILHAGDLACLDVLRRLGALAPTVAVRGNVDPLDVAETLPRKREVRLDGRIVGLIHGDRDPEIRRTYLRRRHDYEAPAMETFYGYLMTELPAAEVIVFGHFHVPVVKEWNGRLLVNPGSLHPRKGPATVALMSLGDGWPEIGRTKDD